MWRTLAIVVLLLSSSAARAAQCSGEGDLKEPALCSRSFAFHGACGKPNYQFPEWETVAVAVGAWEKTAIRIVSVSADATVISAANSKAPASWAIIFAGNSVNNDPMTPLRGAAGVVSGAEVVTVAHSEKDFPAGLGMQFPAGKSMHDAHLDVHLDCRPIGANYFGSLTVWYTLDPP
jgi:hypothetical protein